MIRHSRSFFLSLAIHIIILILLFYTWKKIPSFEDEKIQENMYVKLCCVVEKKPQTKVAPITKPVPKKEIKKVIPKEKKIVKTAHLAIPVLKEKTKSQEETIEEKITEPEIVQKKEKVQRTKADKQKVATQVQSTQEESPHAKEVRIAEEYVNEHIKRLVKLLQDNLYYPRSARKRGIEGSVVVKFILSPDATAYSIEVISSNSEILSRAAIQTIKNLSGKFPKPKEKLVLNVPIKYDLN